MMKTHLVIGIDARYLFRDKRGIGNVLHNLITSIAEIDGRNRYLLFTDREPEVRPSLPDNFSVVAAGPRLYPLWEQVVLPILSVRHRLDVLHCPGNTAPVLVPGSARVVITIHDLINFSLAYRSTSESLFKAAARVYSRLVIPRAARSAAAITTVSDYSKRDILANLPGVRAEVTVIPNAESFSPDVGTDVAGRVLIRGRFAGETPFFLCLGARDARKNTALTLSVFLRHIDRLPAGTRLVVAGMQQHASEEIERLLGRDPKRRDQVVMLEYVPDADLSVLYRQCVAFLYLSRHEGFGMPLVDAMRHDCPIICSRATSIPEVVGDAAILVDLDQPQQIGDAMVAVSRDPALRAELISKGRRRSQRFSWTASARQLLEIYDACAAS
jgi:glycosyltransferase involved in cell wall biosynthesis